MVHNDKQDRCGCSESTQLLIKTIGFQSTKYGSTCDWLSYFDDETDCLNL